MSSALALANNNSALLSYLQGSAPETSPFTYGLTRNVGSYHRQKKVSVVKTGVAFSSEVRFELPRWGVMKNLTLRAAITMASGADTYYFGVLSGIIAKAEIKARDKVIATIYPETIVDWVKSQPDQAYKMWTDPDHMSLKSNYSAAEYLFDMPLPFSFTERINTAIMARFAEPLELVITTPTSTTGISAAPTNVDLTLKLDYLHPGENTLENMKKSSKDAGPKGIPRLQYSTYKENDTSIAASAAANTDLAITLNCKNPVFRTLIYAHYTGTGDRLQASNIINRIRLQAAGEDLMDFTAAELRQDMVSGPFGDYHLEDDQYSVHSSYDAINQNASVDVQYNAAASITTDVNGTQTLIPVTTGKGTEYTVGKWVVINGGTSSDDISLHGVFEVKATAANSITVDRPFVAAVTPSTSVQITELSWDISGQNTQLKVLDTSKFRVGDIVELNNNCSVSGLSAGVRLQVASIDSATTLSVGGKHLWKAQYQSPVVPSGTLEKVNSASDSRNYHDVFVLNHNLTKSGLDQSGFKSLSALPNPQLIISHDANDAFAVKVSVFHYYNTIESTSGENGQLTIRVLT
jgi:hypothetical protein